MGSRILFWLVVWLVHIGSQLNASADEPEATSLLGKRLAKGSVVSRLEMLSRFPLTGASGGSLMAKATSRPAQTLLSTVRRLPKQSHRRPKLKRPRVTDTNCAKVSAPQGGPKALLSLARAVLSANASHTLHRCAGQFRTRVRRCIRTRVRRCS